MDDLKKEIETYNEMKDELESQHMSKWVLIHGNKLVSTFESFEAAAEDAMKRYGHGPYLIRQVGAKSVNLSASVMYRFEHGRN